MTNIAIVYHSGYGHTQAVAEAVGSGARIAGVKVALIPTSEAEAREAELDGADAIIFGSPTYMGGVSADFARFKDWTSTKWQARAWQDKLAAGFTVSASWGGDKQNTLYQLLTLAQQQGMVWVGLGLAPGYNHSKGSPEDLNRTGASLGLMAQANADQSNEGIGQSELATARALGKRVAEAALRWKAVPLAQAA
jgi:multimeric flavodoxin WrbA